MIFSSLILPFVIENWIQQENTPETSFVLFSYRSAWKVEVKAATFLVEYIFQTSCIRRLLSSVFIRHWFIAWIYDFFKTPNYTHGRQNTCAPDTDCVMSKVMISIPYQILLTWRNQEVSGKYCTGTTKIVFRGLWQNMKWSGSSENLETQGG